MGIGASGAGAASSHSTPSARSSPGASSSSVNPALRAAAENVVSQICREELALSHTGGYLKEFTIFQKVEESYIEDVMRLSRQDVRAKRAMGSLVGMAVADSVGGLFEFLPVGTEGSKFDAKTLKACGVYNKFALKPGQWTDDTSMGLCMADSLLVCNGYDGRDIRIRFWNWWERGYNNTFRLDSERHESVGLGGNVSLSLLIMTRKTSLGPRYEGLGEDAGNGSVMRLAPVPIFFHSDVDLAVRVSAESSYTTHPGPSAADACGFFGFLIAKAISRDARCKKTAKKFLDECAAEYLRRPEVQLQPSLQKLLRSEEPSQSKERCWNWRDPKGPFLLETIANRGKFYNGYPVQADYFGSYSMDGLAIALHSMYHTKSYMAAVARCVNFLGDADSTGAICGQLAGAFYGVDAIDDRLIDRLRQWDAGQIALRGALLYVLGTDLPKEVKERAAANSASALAHDRGNLRHSVGGARPQPSPGVMPALPPAVKAAPNADGSMPALPQTLPSCGLLLPPESQQRAPAPPGCQKPVLMKCAAGRVKA